MANCNSSSSTSAVSVRQSHGPPCHCGRVTNMLMSWTDANPGRRFYKCEEHGFVIWADDEKPGGWQKESLLEARDQIRRYRSDINRLNVSVREAREQLVRERALRVAAETVSDVVDHEIFQEELLKREKMLRQMFAMSWGGFILMTATLVYMLKN